MMKRGDRVKCVDNLGREDELMVGGEYTLADIDDNGFVQVGPIWYRGTRFKSLAASTGINSGDTVRCIQTDEHYTLRYGQEYEVEDATSLTLKLVGLDNRYARHRFELVLKTRPSKKRPTTELEFFSAVREGNCPCDIPRSDCNLHD